MSQEEIDWEHEYFKLVKDRQEELQMIHDRQKREKDEFRIWWKDMDYPTFANEIPTDEEVLKDVMFIDHRRVTGWQNIPFSTDEEDEGN